MNILKKIKSVSWSDIKPLLAQAKKRSKRSTVALLRDLYQSYKQGYTWADYFAYDFANNQEPSYRESFICVNRHYPLITKHFGLSREENDFFNDKGLFNRNFADLRGIRTLDLRQDNFASFADFIRTFPVFFAKTADGMGGTGVKRYTREAFGQRTSQEIYDLLIERKLVILEEPIKQHAELAKLSENAVNTIRVVTCRTMDGEMNVPFVASRISVTDAYVDNGSMGGAYCILDESGTVRHDYFTHLPILKEYQSNPRNGFVFKDFKFPYYREAIDLCVEASKRCKGHYIGWDVAISENGPILIEANLAPTPQLFQAINQSPDGLGRLDELEEALKVRLRP